MTNSFMNIYRIWVAAGKPKQGTIFNDMKDAKYKYKLAVRDSVRFYESRFSDDLLDNNMKKIRNLYSAIMPFYRRLQRLSPAFKRYAGFLESLGS